MKIVDINIFLSLGAVALSLPPVHHSSLNSPRTASINIIE